jgi:hypothetical protein
MQYTNAQLCQMLTAERQVIMRRVLTLKREIRLRAGELNTLEGRLTELDNGEHYLVSEMRD